MEQRYQKLTHILNTYMIYFLLLEASSILLNNLKYFFSSEYQLRNRTSFANNINLNTLILIPS